MYRSTISVLIGFKATCIPDAGRAFVQCSLLCFVCRYGYKTNKPVTESMLNRFASSASATYHCWPPVHSSLPINSIWTTTLWFLTVWRSTCTTGRRKRSSAIDTSIHPTIRT